MRNLLRKSVWIDRFYLTNLEFLAIIYRQSNEGENMRDNTVKIMRGGNILYKTHGLDEDGRMIQQDPIDVTDNMPSFLFNECTFEDNLTLKDVFDLVEKHVEILSIIIPYHIQEFISESKSDEAVSDYDITSLEIYRTNDHDIFEDSNELLSSICFHGLSNEKELSIGLDFMPVNKIIHLPITQNTEFKIHGGLGYETGATTYDFGNQKFTLMDIIHGIFYELSFYGPPIRRNENAQIIRERLDDT